MSGRAAAVSGKGERGVKGEKKEKRGGPAGKTRGQERWTAPGGGGGQHTPPPNPPCTVSHTPHPTPGPRPCWRDSGGWGETTVGPPRKPPSGARSRCSGFRAALRPEHRETTTNVRAARAVACGRHAGRRGDLEDKTFAQPSGPGSATPPAYTATPPMTEVTSSPRRASGRSPIPTRWYRRWRDQVRRQDRQHRVLRQGLRFPHGGGGGGRGGGGGLTRSGPLRLGPGFPVAEGSRFAVCRQDRRRESSISRSCVNFRSRRCARRRIFRGRQRKQGRRVSRRLTCSLFSSGPGKARVP